MGVHSSTAGTGYRSVHNEKYKAQALPTQLCGYEKGGGKVSWMTTTHNSPHKIVPGMYGKRLIMRQRVINTNEISRQHRISYSYSPLYKCALVVFCLVSFLWLACGILIQIRCWYVLMARGLYQQPDMFDPSGRVSLKDFFKQYREIFAK